MVVATHDGGGGGQTDGFTGGPYYDEGKVHGGGSGSASGGGLDADSALESGLKDVFLGPGFNIAAGLIGEGAYDKVAAAMQKSHPEQLTDMASTWSTIASRTNSYASRLSSTISKISSAWSGDDADEALKILTGIYATLNSQGTKSQNMSTALQNMGSNMQQMKDSFHSQSIGGTITNSFTGSDDRNAENSYKQLMSAFKSDLQLVPETVPKQLKPGAGGPSNFDQTLPTHAGGPSPAPSVGGPGSAPHVGNPANPTISKPPTVHPTIEHPEVEHPEVKNPTLDNPNLDNPNGTDYPGIDTSSPYGGGGAGLGGTPGIDTSGSLAGYDGSGAGGAGSLGGGAGLGSGAGAGAGAGGALGGGAGSGLGAGAGAGGLGSGAGAGGVVGGGAGGRGMMPMHGGHNNDDDERERTTWLNEDDDVWGAEENLPGVIH